MSASSGEAEHPLGDDVALDFGRSGVDRFRLRPHPAVLPAAVLQREWRLRRERAVRALKPDRELLHALVHLAPVELGEARLWAGRMPMLGAGQGAQADDLEDVG